MIAHLELIHDGDNLIFQRLVGDLAAAKVDLVANKDDRHLHDGVNRRRRTERRREYVDAELAKMR